MNDDNILEPVTVAEAASRLSIPAGTIRAWISRRLLHPVGHGPGRTKLYALQHVRTLADSSTRRSK